MRGDPLRAKVLSVRMIPRADGALKERFSLRPQEQSLGLITCDSDDVGYTALDEATKKAEVRVCYAQSMYAGAANANTALAGRSGKRTAGRGGVYRAWRMLLFGQ